MSKLNLILFVHLASCKRIWSRTPLIVEGVTSHNNFKTRGIHQGCFWQTQTHNHSRFRSPDSTLRIILGHFPLIMIHLTNSLSVACLCLLQLWKHFWGAKNSWRLNSSVFCLRSGTRGIRPSLKTKTCNFCILQDWILRLNKEYSTLVFYNSFGELF